jgi:hypothetical protein
MIAQLRGASVWRLARGVSLRLCSAKILRAAFVSRPRSNRQTEAVVSKKPATIRVHLRQSVPTKCVQFPAKKLVSAT